MSAPGDTGVRSQGARGPADEIIVGIDLGTTNSLVAAAMPPDPPRCLADEGGRVMLPSAVRFEPGRAGPVVGEDARREATLHPASTVLSVKRLMGRSRADAEKSGDLAYLAYDVVEGPNNTARVRLPDGRTVSAPEVSAHILRRLKEIAEARLGRAVSKAVVTVPAYFDDAQRQATRDAARLAGLEAVRLVNEPTAAALAYGLGVLPGASVREAQNVAVFDLGGGTFDLSILRLTPSEAAAPGGADFFQVLSTAGDTHLGGDDFDHALVGLFTREINERLATPERPLSFPAETRQALRQLAEQVKIRLTDAESASVAIDIGEGRSYSRTVTRDEFEELVDPLIDRAMSACRRAMRDAKRALAGEAIGAVILVGGSTRVPRVRERVREYFGIEPYTAIDPDQAVAIGAAIQGSILAGATTGSLLLDVVPLSLGIETAHGGVAKLIMRNAAVPARATERFSTQADNQTAIKLHVLQGEREMAADCRSLGVFHLRGIPPMPAGIPQLEVEFLVDSNGILRVCAVEKRSGKRAELQVVPNHGLTPDEVERIERESFAHAKEDMTRHRIADLIANSRLDLKWIAAQLEKRRALLEPAYAAELDGSIARLRGLVELAGGDWRAVDAGEFHKAKEALDRASVRLHEISITESLKGDAAR